MTYPERVCPECLITFTPNKKRQVYHSASCRVKANRKKHRDDIPSLDATGLLNEIRKVDTETAADIEDIAKRAGVQIAEEILLVCWRAMHRAAFRHGTLQVVDMIESGDLVVKKTKSRKVAKSTEKPQT